MSRERDQTSSYHRSPVGGFTQTGERLLPPASEQPLRERPGQVEIASVPAGDELRRLHEAASRSVDEAAEEDEQAWPDEEGDEPPTRQRGQADQQPAARAATYPQQGAQLGQRTIQLPVRWLVGGAGVITAILLLVYVVGPFLAVKKDDYQYGRPRMDRVYTWLNLAEERASGQPTYIESVNLAVDGRGRPGLIVVAGSNLSQGITVEGPPTTMFSGDIGLLPAVVGICQVPGTGYPHIYQTIQNRTFYYVNDGTLAHLRPAKEDEAQMLAASCKAVGQ